MPLVQSQKTRISQRDGQAHAVNAQITSMLAVANSPALFRAIAARLNNRAAITSRRADLVTGRAATSSVAAERGGDDSAPDTGNTVRFRCNRQFPIIIFVLTSLSEGRCSGPRRGRMRIAVGKRAARSLRITF